KGDGSDYITDYGEPSDPPATSSIPCPAPTPANVIATPVAKDKIKVSWDTQTGVTAYKLERSDDGGTSWPSANAVQVLPTPTSTSHEVTNLKCGTAYTFRISGKGDGMAHSGITYSSFRFGETSDHTDPLAAAKTDFFCTPQNLSVTPLVRRRARVSWQRVTNATGYALFC
ncbi:MAG: fibronectin type III domain-containing protein, partial [Chloroflexota bacterium]|nr:fibronectin type III domain-containing protein [Chloroflexota bacterium]